MNLTSLPPSPALVIQVLCQRVILHMQIGYLCTWGTASWFKCVGLLNKKLLFMLLVVVVS